MSVSLNFLKFYYINILAQSLLASPFPWSDGANDKSLNIFVRGEHGVRHAY